MRIGRHTGKASLVAIILLSLALLPSISRSDMYKWTDEEGNLHFSDTPPESGAATRMMRSGDCQLKKELEGKREDVVTYLLMTMLGDKPADDRLISEGYRDIVEQYKEEEKRCQDGNKEACRCIASLNKKNDEGATSFAPKEDSPETNN